MKGISVNISTVEHLFPFSFVMSRELDILYIGKSLNKMANHIELGNKVNKYFSLDKPKMDFTSITHNLLNKMIFMTELKTKSQFMGQIIKPGRHDVYIFVGSLVVVDASDFTRLGLTFADFPIQDQVFDFLMMTQTQRRSIKEAEEINRKLSEAHKIAVSASMMKSQFLANMSHELRTPMNGIVGMASLLTDGTQLSDEQKMYVTSIIDSADAMLSLVNDILDLSKIESGHIELQISEFNLLPLLDEINKVISTLAVKNHNIVIIENFLEENDLIKSDRLKLRQVLINLMGNANKFTESGKIKLTVTSDENYLIFSIQDTGIGMNEETLQRIFKPFVQGDASMTKKFGGTGLGLSISKKIVESLQGAISAESTLGLGSKFEFKIARSI